MPSASASSGVLTSQVTLHRVIDLFGVLADWFTGIVAAVALFFAARAAKAARDTNTAQQQTLKLQQQQFQDLEYERRQSQASRVSYWWVDPTRIAISNTSESPIYQIGYLNPKKKTYHVRRTVIVGLGASPSTVELDDPVSEDESWDARLYFSDATGRRWTRDYLGVLTQCNKMELDDELRVVLEGKVEMSETEKMRLVDSWRFVQNEASLRPGGDQNKHIAI